jgi:hypothetical protein
MVGFKILYFTSPSLPAITWGFSLCRTVLPVTSFPRPQNTIFLENYHHLVVKKLATFQTPKYLDRFVNCPSLDTKLFLYKGSAHRLGYPCSSQAVVLHIRVAVYSDRNTGFVLHVSFPESSVVHQNRLQLPTGTN